MTDEKKAQLKQVREKMKSLTPEQRQELLNRGLVATIEGRVLSVHNTIYCYLQSTGGKIPTVVGGYKQWKVAGRQVSKGEHGYSIMFPAGNTSVDNEGNKTVEAERFFFTTVFDVTQTEDIKVEA